MIFLALSTNIFFSDRSLSELIQHCLGCRDLEGEAEDADLDPSELPALHQECAQPTPSLEQIRSLLQDGCDPNQILAGQGRRAALHTLLLVPHADDAPLVPCAAALLAAGASLSLRDAAGNTPLNCLEALMRQGRMAETAEICELFLSSSSSTPSLSSSLSSSTVSPSSPSNTPMDDDTTSSTPPTQCDVNCVDGRGRTLLSHSVTYLDLAAEVTRILVNHGGRVWPGPAPSSPPATVESLVQDREQSAFTWFLRSLIQTNSLGGAESTLNCLSHEMGRDPGRMKSHVMRVMLAEGKHPCRRHGGTAPRT